MSENELVRFRLLVRGRVQGVGFRRFVWKVAHSLPIAGWVRNSHDGSVEIEVGGDIRYVGSFIANVRKGPFFSRVDEIEEMRRETLLSMPEAIFEIR